MELWILLALAAAGAALALYHRLVRGRRAEKRKEEEKQIYPLW